MLSVFFFWFHVIIQCIGLPLDLKTSVEPSLYNTLGSIPCHPGLSGPFFDSCMSVRLEVEAGASPETVVVGCSADSLGSAFL